MPCLQRVGSPEHGKRQQEIGGRAQWRRDPHAFEGDRVILVESALLRVEGRGEAAAARRIDAHLRPCRRGAP
ncbi:hypothetical protein [Leifsonia xyli]|uniref:hypothetical protein n=1 Tax=Leifsonia xyli TaxID=1575 RepID=UPI00146FC3C6|nr:hypothetical protein [Leifsonia xyli]